MSATIDLLKSHIRTLGWVQYTGREHDANKMLGIMPVYVSFVRAHLEYFEKQYGYKIRRGCDAPGQKAKIFAPFRDVWLPMALRAIRAEDLNVPVSEVEETAFLYKKNQLLSTSKKPCIHAIVGWVDTRRSPGPEEDAEAPATEAGEEPAEWPFGQPSEDGMQVDNDPSLMSAAEAMLFLSESAESF